MKLNVLKDDALIQDIAEYSDIQIRKTPYLADPFRTPISIEIDRIVRISLLQS